MLRKFQIIALLLSAMLTAPCHAEFKAIAGWDEQVFPSYLISTAAIKHDSKQDSTTLGDCFGSFGVEVTATRSSQAVQVSVTCEGIAETSEFVGILPQAGTTYRVFPKMKYHFDKLAACKQAMPTTVTFRVKLDRQIVEEKSTTVTLRSISDCPFALVDGEDVTEMNLCFAAYVNEQHPFVDKLLREALSIGMVRSFTGYQSNDPKEVMAQVYAVWDLMVTRDMRYSDITTTAALSLQSRSQHVRLLEDTINNKQANCVDGSVLIASVLRKIGIDAALVVTKNHCYLAFWADREHKLMYGLETTLVSADLVDQDVPTAYDDVIAEDLRWDYSWANFAHALQAGTHNLQTEIDKPELEIAFIDIASARLQGVLPIPFHGSEQFVATEIEYLDSDEESYDEEVSGELDMEEDESDAFASSDSESDTLEWDNTPTPTKQKPVRTKATSNAELEWE